MKPTKKKTVLRWGGYVTAIAVTLVALTQLVDWIGGWFAEPSSNLVAEVTFGEFHVPPYITDELETLADPEVLKSTLIDYLGEELPDELVSRLVGHLSRDLQGRLQMSVLWPLHRETLGYWSVDVRNDGTKAVEAVNIKLPYAIYASIKRESGDAEHRKTPELIPLGEIQPREEVQIIAWTRHTLSSKFPSGYWGNQIRLTHASGIGTVTVGAELEVGRFWLWLADWWVPVGFALLFLAVWTSGFIFIHLSAERSDGEPTGGEQEEPKG